MLKAIVFDFDGVLVESVDIKGQAFVALYEDQSEEIQRQVLSYHNQNGGVTRFDKIRYYEEILLGRQVSQSQVEKLADRFGVIVEEKVTHCPWIAGAQEFLRTYATHIPLYIASATPEDELHRIVKGRGAFEYFKAVFGTPVKKKEHLANILREERYAPKDIVMVGDAMTDYDAAIANDVPFIGIVREGEKSPFPDNTHLLPDLRSLAVAIGIA